MPEITELTADVPVEPEMEQEVPRELDREEVAKALEAICSMARNEDITVRTRYINICSRLDYYWNNILDVFRNPVTGIWEIPDWTKLEDEIPPRLINIYRPHGEAIVAALSVAIPPVYFHPDDADNPDDVETARAYRSIVDLLQLHNDAAMQLIKMIVIMFNHGTIFGYNYLHPNPKLGTIKTPKIALTDITSFDVTCPQCGFIADIPEDTPSEMLMQEQQCPQCGFIGVPEMMENTDQIPQIVGYDESPKSMVCQELYSLINVKIPMYAKKPEDCGYLLLEFPQSKAMLRSVFMQDIQASYYDASMNFQIIPINYFQQMPDNAATVTCMWVRPWQFWFLNDEILVGKLLKLFPDGCYSIFVNKTFMTAYPENMDDHWTISPNPMGDTLYARPLGENLATIQDIRAQSVEIKIQTAEFGIPETFADPRVLDFNKYGMSRSQPGMMTQAKALPGKTIAEGFFTNKPAILSPEVDSLTKEMDQDAQFVTGSYPSVYGGPSTGGSKTAKEYEQSRAAALQRLGTINKILNSFFADFEARSATEYANMLKELGQDERFTKRDGQNFINNWIRVASLQGKIGRVEPEASDQLPTSWAQKKDMWFQLIGLNNDLINSALFHPRNVGFAKEVTGLDDFYVPGEDSRMRQLAEFQLCAQGIYVPINPELDNNPIHLETLKTLLEGPMRDGLTEIGMQMNMIHLQEHLQVEAQMMEQQLAQQAAQQDSAPDNGSLSPKGESNGGN